MSQTICTAGIFTVLCTTLHDPRARVISIRVLFHFFHIEYLKLYLFFLLVLSLVVNHDLTNPTYFSFAF